jgi:hypothetical protein
MKLLIFLAVVGILAFAGYGWHSVYVHANHATADIGRDSDERLARDEARLKAINDENEGLERRIEHKYWNSSRELRDWRKQVATTLAADQQTKNGQSIAADQAALVRIQARLKELHAQ